MRKKYNKTEVRRWYSIKIIEIIVNKISILKKSMQQPCNYIKQAVNYYYYSQFTKSAQ